MENIYNQTLTILNKLKKDDSSTNVDVWHKTVIQNGYFSKKVVANVSGTTTSLGEVDKVMIPFSKNYKPYKEWKQVGQQDGYYTMSNGDYVVNADVTEDVTANNIVATLKKYGDDVCTVRVVTECINRMGTQNVQIMIEGV